MEKFFRNMDNASIEDNALSLLEAMYADAKESVPESEHAELSADYNTIVGSIKELRKRGDKSSFYHNRKRRYASMWHQLKNQLDDQLHGIDMIYEVGENPGEDSGTEVIENIAKEMHSLEKKYVKEGQS